MANRGASPCGLCFGRLIPSVHLQKVCLVQEVSAQAESPLCDQVLFSGTRCGWFLPLTSPGQPLRSWSPSFDNFVSFEFSQDGLVCERFDVDMLCLLRFYNACPVPIELTACSHACRLARRFKNASKYGENFFLKERQHRACQCDVQVRHGTRCLQQRAKYHPRHTHM